MLASQITEDNYLDKIFRFRDRQAGISVVFNPDSQRYTYNAYCLETKIMKELLTVEYEFLVDALNLINDEFGSWDLIDVHLNSKGCGSCTAK